MDSLSTTTLIKAVGAGMALGWIAVPHCLSMCGPLHISVCAFHPNRSFRAISLFNLGRVIGYTLAGLVLGFAGHLVNLAAPACAHCAGAEAPGLANLALSLLFPAVLMFYIAYKGFRKQGFALKLPAFLKPIIKLDQAQYLPLMGAVTVFIPCGMLYAAFAGAVAFAAPLAATIFMFAFVVTQSFFMQLGISLGQLLNKKWNTLFERVFPWLALMLGCAYLVFFIKKAV
ncbi:MAG: sulfite exporter TauE/SafE family protein [Phycisphaerae bacterium]|nr:sulfite exporter TauE/SafE family protein [Phycisphaerae bacterium]